MSRMDEAMQELVDAIQIQRGIYQISGYQKQSAQSAAVRAADPRIPPQQIICYRTVMEMWIFMMRRIRWNRNTVSFGKIHLSQNILQQKMLFAVWCRRSTGR